MMYQWPYERSATLDCHLLCARVCMCACATDACLPRLRQVQDLEAQLKEKVELYSELLLRKEELERNLEQQQVQTLELQQLTSQLEKELQAKTRIEDELRQVRVARGADRCVLVVRLSHMFCLKWRHL